MKGLTKSERIIGKVGFVAFLVTGFCYGYNVDIFFRK